MARAAVYSIGTELTRGELVNSNAAVLAELLTRHGFEVTKLVTVDDDAGRIESAFRELCTDHEVVVTTGGLGPTTDDITTECVARVLGVPLERDASSLAAIEERFRRFERPMAKSNEKQADFPRGARVLPNPNGTAPGFAVELGRARAFFMPGVPREMLAMMEAHVLPSVSELVDSAHHQVLLRTHGMAESDVNDRLAGVEAAFDVIIGYRATFPVIEVKVLARDRESEVALRRAHSAAEEVRRRLGDEVVFAEGKLSYTEALGALLMERHLRLACAESCTGGLVGELITRQPGASRYFAGSAVVYENSAKTALLGVDAALIAEHGAVSREVALAMAEGALTRFDADVALAITGIAGPDGGSAEKPVGLVHYAVVTRQGQSHAEFVWPGTREQVRLRAAYAALSLVRRVVRHGHHE